MKLHALLLLTLVGCLKPIPPEPPKPVVVVIPATKGEIVSVEILPEPEPPVHTWMTGEELQKVLDERAKAARERGEECYDGDPLCPNLP